MKIKRIYRAKDWEELKTIIYGYELTRIVWIEAGKNQITVGVR